MTKSQSPLSSPKWRFRNGSIVPLLFLSFLGVHFMGNETKQLRPFANGTLRSLQGQPQKIKVDADINNNNMATRARQDAICNHTGTGQYDQVWAQLCNNSVVYAFDKVLSQQRPKRQTARVVQIGAHVGFEENDPLANGILGYLRMLSPEERHQFQWTFVEPSTANYQSLQKNLAQHNSLANLQAVHAGVVADSTNETTDMTFYSIRDTIDPVTGFDSLSNKTFPAWITQVSSFSMAPIRFNRGVWRRLGLKMKDYVIESHVTTKRYSDLMRDILNGDNPDNLVLVLIDTEGFDCHIVNGIDPHSPYLPQFLVFEDKQCKRPDKEAAMSHLQAMGYVLHPVYENVVAIKQSSLSATATTTTTSS